MVMLKASFVLFAACTIGALASQRKYDGSTLSYDPKGRMFQVEYAMEATRRGRTVLGVCGDCEGDTECVALVTREPSPHSAASCRTVSAGGVWAVDSHVGIVASGLRSDIQYVVDCARTWCSEHRFVFGGPMPCQMLARRLADLMHSCTTRGGKRPLAVDILIGGVDDHAGASLHQIQATGAFQRYRSVAAGGGGAPANTQLAANMPPRRQRSPAGGSSKSSAIMREDVPQAEDEAGIPGRGKGDDTSGGGGDVETRAKDSNARGRRTPGSGTAAEMENQEEERQRGRRRLDPGHRAVLKRALSALLEGDPESRRSSTGDGSSGDSDASLQKRSLEDRGGRAFGGLRASELSATVYGVDAWSSSLFSGERGRGVSCEADPEINVQEGRHAIQCSTEDLEELLLELEREERDSRGKKKRKKKKG